MNDLSITNGNGVSRRVIPGPVCKDVSAEAFMSFISSLTVNIGRATFYNLKEEQRQVMIDQHQLIFERIRPVYALLMLPEGINDVNKSLILYNLITHTYRDPNLKSHERDALTQWENELGVYMLRHMQPNRVLDLFEMLVDQKVTNKRAFNLFHTYLAKNDRSWPLWALKYRKQLKKCLRHFHTGIRSKNTDLAQIWRYLKYDEINDNSPELLQDYVKTQQGSVDHLFKLPLTVAEGFREKFNLSMKDFTNKFTQKGKLSNKEKRIRTVSVAKATNDEATTGFDFRKASLFDALVFLSSGAKVGNMYQGNIRHHIRLKAMKIAEKLPFGFDNTAIIFDNSVSMYGTGDQKLHPLLRAIAVSWIIQTSGIGNIEFLTNGTSGSKIIPQIGNQSNYADTIIGALATGEFKNIVIIGDGYENAPFQGAAHQIIYTFKKKIDTENKVSFFHINPVFSAESKDVRSISELAPAVGVRDIETFPETMFLAMGKSRPTIAARVYLQNLLEIQPERAKEMMPQNVENALTRDVKKLLV